MRFGFSAMLLVFAPLAVGAERATIEEIVVTAEKREASVMDVPIAITAFGESELQRKQITDTRKIQHFVPSLSYQQTPSGVTINLRGVGTDNSGAGGEAGVSMYMNGVYLGHPYSNAASFQNLERVEVLRGPQGTLYGRNTTGGSINFITRAPEFQTSGQLTGIAGSDHRGLLQFSGTTGLIDDVLAVRLAVSHDERDGYRRNRSTGRDVDESDEDAVDLSLLWQISENVDLVLRADWLERAGSRPLAFYVEVPSAGAPITAAFGAQSCFDDADCVYNDVKPRDNNRMWGASGTLTWDLGSATFKSISAFRDARRTYSGDVDATSMAYQHYAPGFAEEADEWSQEFNLSGTAFESSLDWIVGLYYYKDDLSGTHQYELDFLTPILQGAGLLQPIPRITGGQAAVAFLDFSLTQELDSFAVFGQATYHLTDALRGTLGLRYTKDDKTGVQRHSSNFALQINCPGFTQQEDWSEVSGKFGLDFDLSPSSMVYASVSKGFKAGGFSLSECGNSYDPEILWAYEVGYKSRFMDGRMQLGVAAFYYDYEDLQVRKFIQNQALILNAADATVAGIDLDFKALVGNFVIDGGLVWLDSEYQDFESNNGTRGNALEDLSGTQLQRAPDIKLNLGLSYQFVFDSGATLTPQYEYAYSDRMHTDVFDDPWGRIDSKTLHNVRLEWVSADAAWSVQGFVENLTDEEYLEYLNPVVALGGSIGYWGPPRVWGVQATYTFER